MDLKNLLSTVEMFTGLDDEQLEQIAEIFSIRDLNEGEVVFQQGEEANSLFLIDRGFIEVVHTQPSTGDENVIIHLGPGQSVGEMALIDRGLRSATVRAATNQTTIAMVSRAAFESFCESNSAIGYRVMKNIASDLSFRLRHRGLEYSQS